MYFDQSARVRQAAVSCAPALLVSAAQAADSNYVRNLFNFIYESLLEGIQQEMDLDILAMMLVSFVEVTYLFMLLKSLLFVLLVY